MTTQMEYIASSSNQSMDLWGNEIITGVPVTLTAIGEDGTYVDIGTTTQKDILEHSENLGFQQQKAHTKLLLHLQETILTVVLQQQLGLQLVQRRSRRSNRTRTPTNQHDMAIIIAVIAVAIIAAVAYLALRRRK